ncbi:C39 family peptidase [Halomicroarcula sp. S1AR25-4]|uniref:C39 family peptidase n=1 Tax=Haloarcula sp. S1AR25-4 TaxID=2950538 RepID=UPI0028756D72|nr:C39 family peptidase [Halomicroarcula sp. S1AR25-4]MDS0279719.1 C39 family peptidase [Halomicroarcula sp. S1AR25-4]
MDEKHTSRRDVLRGIGGVGLTGAALTAVGSAAAQGKAPVKKATARKTARAAADYYGDTEEFGEWRASGVKAPTLFYTDVQDGGSTTHVPRSWVFPIENRGEDVGYINVSARQTEQPILTFGANRAPQRRLADAKRKTPASPKSITGRFLYRGGVEYLVESTDVGAVDLRSGKPKQSKPVADLETLLPTGKRNDSGAKEQTSQEDWSGDTDDEVYGVPNWTEHDAGNANSTSIGSGDDSWDSWDGCVPIAASMVLGFHENLDDSDDDARESLIDRLHMEMDTGDGSLCSYCTYWSNIPSGIENYSSGSHSYSAENIHSGFKGNVKTQISNDNPFMLNMENGPYTDKGEGHSVCGIGYREESCGWFCSDMYYKVHNGYDDSPDLVTHGAWGDVCITKVTT